jgi:hypothetical protein
MSQRRNQAGMFPGAFGGFSRIGEQEMYDPTWANIDFADFKGLDMNLINENAKFSQEIANDRLKDILKQRDAILDKVKLHKRYSDLKGQLDNKLGSIIDNMGNVQLSDAANYTALNTNLIKTKNDPVLQNAVKVSEEAMAYEKYKSEHPEIVDQAWNNGELENNNEINFQRFLRGETNDFQFNPVYKEYGVQAKADAFVKDLPAEERNSIEKYGVYGLQEKAVEDKSVARVQQAFEPFKQGLMQDPEFISWYNRRGKYEENRGGSIDDVINNMFKSSAARYGTSTPNIKVSMPREHPDIGTGIQIAENARAQGRYDAEVEEGTLGGGRGNNSATGQPYVNYNDSTFSPVGNETTLIQADKINTLKNLLNKSQQKGGEGAKPILLSDPNKDSIVRNKKQEAIRYTSEYQPTGYFTKGNNNNVFVEVKGKDDKIYYVQYDQGNFERNVVGVPANTTTSTNTPSEKEKVDGVYDPSTGKIK